MQPIAQKVQKQEVEPKKKARVMYAGREVFKGMRIQNNADGGLYKVTSVRPNGKITCVCKKLNKRSTIRGRVEIS